MDPEEYEKIFGYLSDKKYPNDIKESEKRRIRKMSYKVNHGGEVWHVLNICVFLIAIKLNKPN